MNSFYSFITISLMDKSNVLAGIRHLHIDELVFTELSNYKDSHSKNV